MTPKQNALEVIRFGRPQWVPFGVPFRRVAYLGCDHQGYDGGGHHLPVGARWTDIWGTTWHREHEGVMGFPKGHPLADFPAAMKHYAWPDPDDDRLVRRIYQQAETLKPECGPNAFLQGAHRDTLWEKCYMLIGMENAMCALLTEPAATRELLHRIMDFQLGIAEHYAAVGVEMVSMSDDLGTQRGPLLSPELVSEFLVPEYRRLFDFHKSRGVLIRFHSCGQITDLLETFLDLGVDVLNPIQATANDLSQLRQATEGRMALEGGINCEVIVAGPIERISQLVRERLWQLGRDGGYFASPDQGMPWPDEHIAAAREAVKQFGRYPLEPYERRARKP